MSEERNIIRKKKGKKSMKVLQGNCLNELHKSNDQGYDFSYKVLT